MLTNPAWDDLPGLRHGFLERADCVGIASWDDALARVGLPLPVAAPRQVHGTDVVVVGEGPDGVAADAVVAARPGVLVGVATADCVPILLLAPRTRVVAAVHAGWRGAATGVIEATLARMRSRFGVEPGEVAATVGPAIGACCYPVGSEVFDAFRSGSGDVTKPAWGVRADGCSVLDLRRAVDRLLEAAGVPRRYRVGPCTSCAPAFASYRRDGVHAGRQLSVIGWGA